MDFAILGPLRVVGPDGEIELRAPKHRALLATLLLGYRDGAVSATRLIDVLWDETPAGHRDQGAAGPRLPAAPAARAGHDRDAALGLRRARRRSLDLERFEALSAQARTAPPREAVELLREALALFRGPPLADAPLLRPRQRRAPTGSRAPAWTRSNAASSSSWTSAAARSSSPSSNASPPSTRTASASTRQLMLALYRSGRQADALDAYRRARHALVEDLGLDPSPELQRLEAQILAHDPDLNRARPQGSDPFRLEPTADPAPPLPLPATPLLGREEDLEVAAGAAGRTRTCGCSR